MARDKNWSYSSFDEAENISVVGQYVWDSGTLAWIKAIPSAGGGGGGLTDAQLRATPVPVSGTFFQATQPVSGTFFQATQPVSGAFFQATQPVSAVALPLPTGASTEATLATRLSESDFDTKTGSLTEAAPATDTASSGLNGRLQRIAQRITSLLAVLPAALVGGRLDVTIGASPATVPVSGTFWQVTQPVSGTVTTSPPANASTNVAQIAGTATDVNSGLKSAGTIRVVLATDQPALTNKLLVTPDSVALPANQSVNVAQMGGVATSMNTGVRDTGTQRVTIATNDVVPVSGTVAVTAAALPLPANAAQEAGGNLAALLAAIGSAADKPSAFTLLDRLYQLGLKLDKQNKEATQTQVLAALSKPVPKNYTTLLHR